MTDPHARFMRRALELAERGWGRVHPNPLVGAVVVRDGVIVGEGLHREFGGAHAEVEALAAAGDAARDATLYVTLEPCSHQGKTPACTDAITRAGVATVVFGADDPHPEARGGAEILRHAGINVVAGVEAEAVRAQNAIFFHQLTHDRPFIALKLAMSLDARIAAAPGQRTKITSDEADQEVHRLRSGFDAIMIGNNTARVDDPLLTVRHARPSVRPPVRIVLDSNATTSSASALVRSVSEAPLWVVCGAAAPRNRREELEKAGAQVVVIDAADETRLPIQDVLRELRARGIHSVLCEGGNAVAATLVEEGLVDRLYAFIAPIILGAGGVPAFSVAKVEKSGSWRTGRIAQVGNNALLMLERVHN